MRCQKNRNLFRRLKTLNILNTLLLRGPLKNKGLRYYFFVLLLFCSSAFLLFTFTGCDREELIINSWNLQTVLKNGEVFNDSTQLHLTLDYTYYYFFIMNSLDVRTFANGQYTASSNGFYEFVDRSTLRMRFTLLYQSYDITAKIKKLTQKELHLEYKDNGDVYFLKLYGS